MSKLTKPQAKSHLEATKLLDQPTLTLDERQFVLDHWLPSARHINSISGAYFTPCSLARDLSIYIPSNGSLIDLCAGTGHLAFHAIDRWSGSTPHSRIVCIEINPDYVVVGRKVVPEAHWICGDVFSIGLPPNFCSFNAQDRRLLFEPFDFAISNPPFGRQRNPLMPIPGSPIELNVLHIASQLSRCGAFILPQMSCPFKYSGQRNYEPYESNVYRKFRSQSPIDLRCSSIDCSVHLDSWQGVSPSVEIALYDLDEQIEDGRLTVWGNRVTVGQSIYVFDSPPSAQTFARFIGPSLDLIPLTMPQSFTLDLESLFHAGIPLPIEVIQSPTR